MREATDRIGRFERIPTLRSINAPATIVLGITAGDFAVGITTLVAVASIPWFYAPFIALGLAVVFVLAATKIRQELPPRFFAHFLWSLGLFDWEPVKPGTWPRVLRTLRRVGLVRPPARFPNPFARGRRRFVAFVP